MKKKLFILGLFLIGIAATAFAQTATPGATARQGKQHARIAEGRASGELTRRETMELRHQQHRINRHKHAVKADGVVTKRERAGVRLHQNKANRDIHMKKHNRRVRN